MSKLRSEKDRQRCRGCRQYGGFAIPPFNKYGFCPECVRLGLVVTVKK